MRRDRGRLGMVHETIERAGGHAAPVVCDLSDLASVRRAAAEITALRLPLAGLVNNAGTGQTRATKNAQGWVTNVLPNAPGGTGVYYDERGKPMLGSTLARNPEFQDRVVAETRTLLSTVPA